MQVWVPSYCRSTLGFFEILAKQLGRPLRVCLGRSGMGQRGEIGFKEEEFAHLEIVDVSSGYTAALRALEERVSWPQLFGTYQAMPHIRRTIHAALDRGCRVAIASEAPCNMDRPGPRRAAREFYLRHVAPRRFAPIISGADFVINWSGDDAASLTRLGWNENKIIPCGYFPPPLLGSTHNVRHNIQKGVPSILCSGSMTWHRGPDVLMHALALLSTWGVAFRATFTGNGPLFEPMREMAEKWGLDCAFPGLLPLSELIELYQSCSLFIAPGREEPWGMRVNDALNCGAPSIVSRGMGARKLIFDHGLGTTFQANDSVDLAWQIRVLLEDKTKYQLVCENLQRYQTAIFPNSAAGQVANRLRDRFPGWHILG